MLYYSIVYVIILHTLTYYITLYHIMLLYTTNRSSVGLSVTAHTLHPAATGLKRSWYGCLWTKTLLLRGHLPCNTAAQIALQPLIWYVSSWLSQGSSSPEECFFTDTGISPERSFDTSIRSLLQVVRSLVEALVSVARSSIRRGGCVMSKDFSRGTGVPLPRVLETGVFVWPEKRLNQTKYEYTSL